MSRTILILLVLLTLLLPPPHSLAATFPEKPIIMLTVFSAGGGSDTVHRLLEKYAQGIMPQPFVITYKTGAGGEFGWTELASAKPDGYFIGGVDLPHITLQPMVRQKGQKGYSTEQLAPIAGLLQDPNCIMVAKDSPWNTLEEFLEHARKNPNKIKVGIVGKLTGDHIFLMQFQQITGIKLIAIPYPGGPKVGPALISHEVDCYFGSISGHFRMENTRCLAVATQDRYPLAPDIPSLTEKGINLVSVKRRGLAGPRNTNSIAVAYIENVIKKINDNPAYIEDMKKLGVLPEFQTAKAFADSITQEQRTAAKTLKDLGFIQ